MRVTIFPTVQVSTFTRPNQSHLESQSKGYCSGLFVSESAILAAVPPSGLVHTSQVGREPCRGGRPMCSRQCPEAGKNTVTMGNDEKSALASCCTILAQ